MRDPALRLSGRRPRSTTRPGTAAGRRPDSWQAFHAQPVIRRRIEQFLGGPSLEASSARFLGMPSCRADGSRPCWPTGRLWDRLDREPELARSLWDRASLVANLDLEHVHFDEPRRPLVEPERSEALQRPLVEAIERLLGAAGVDWTRLATGRGSHFCWRIDLGSPAFDRLVALGEVDEALGREYDAPQPPAGAAVGRRLGAAWSGLGRLAEHVAHRALAAAGALAVPIELTAVMAGPGGRGREIVSLDLSEYADPIHRRAVRIPYTAYRKRLGGSEPPAPWIVVPACGPGARVRAAARDFGAATRMAEAVDGAIPDGTAGTDRLLDAYRGSPLALFHTAFHAERPHPPELWASTYDRLRLDRLPPCVALPLARPNDRLLEPAALQLVVRVLLAEGWSARHVAGLLRSRFGRPHGWVPDLHFHDAGIRADVYARIFAGLVVTGLDRGVDLNCVSNREKGLCPGGSCPWNLAELARRLPGEAPLG